jgi:hypothetical protein
MRNSPWPKREKREIRSLLLGLGFAKFANHVRLWLGRPGAQRRLHMNRRRRRSQAARTRNVEVGTVIHTQGLRCRDGFHYWFEPPEGWTFADGLPPDAELHGPFKTDAESVEDQKLILLGPQCAVTEGGAWDPAWDRPQ